jgi:ornithine cyclodeaminase
MVWSPNRSHSEEFVRALQKAGFHSVASDTPGQALEGADVLSAVTSSKEAFITKEMLGSVSHANICGVNVPSHAEMTADAIGSFDEIIVDDLPQARVEYGDLIQAAAAGTFRWDSALELGQVVSGKLKPAGRTLFKSGGAALEDVAVASLLYEKARRSGKNYPDVELV